MRRLRLALCSLFMSLAAGMPGPAGAADALPALHADGARTSVSGLSSGAFMAVQYGVAFSGSVIGVARWSRWDAASQWQCPVVYARGAR